MSSDRRLLLTRWDEPERSSSSRSTGRSRHALLQLERYDECAEAATRGLERSPEEIELLDLLALAYMDSGHSITAGRVLEQALEISPEHPILLAHAALAAAKAGEFDEAKELVAKAMRLAPELVVVLRVRAQVAYLAGDREAPQYVDELLAREPEDAIGHALRGNVAIRGKRYVSASRAFEEAARLDPSDDEFADVARTTRVAAHPLLAPVRRSGGSVAGSRTLSSSAS